jgi:pyridoxine kinase
VTSPAVLVISSHVVRGAVGGRAAFVLERAGLRLWSLPTVILPWHPGHGRAQRWSPPAEDFAALADDLAGSPRLAEIGAVLTGYLGAAHQAEPVARLIRAIKAANPAAIHLADPVIGDENGRYVPAEVAEAQRTTLLPLADLATPNRFELAHLTGRSTATLTEAVAAARALGPATVLVTSAPALMRGKTAVAMVTKERAVAAEHPLVAGAPSGTGDLFAALFLARLLSGDPREAALAAAAGGTYQMVARSARTGSGELELAGEQAILQHPAGPVDLRVIAEPGQRS